MAIPSNIKELIYTINKSEDSPNRFWFPYHKSTEYWAPNFDQANYTWFTFNFDFQTDSYYQQNNGTYNFVNTKQTINVISNGNDTYTCQFTLSGDYYRFRSQSTGSNVTWYNFIYSNGVITGSSNTPYQRSLYFNQSGTLNQVFTELAKKVKNINIFVDGEDWTDPDTQSYTWQSVTSLKGINDFSISLPVLSNINDGNPVSGASSSAFTKAPSAENNIKNLVDITLEPVATDSSATIFYTIPSGNYTSIKLYGRIDETPKCDNTDDVVQTLDQNETQISVTNLECGEYYFCIETINSGNVKQYSSVETVDLSFGWDGSEIAILWSGNSNKMTAELITQGGDPFISFKMYLSDNQIYQFTSQYVDTSQVPISRIVKDINIGFLIDNTKQMGRPSNIYYVSDEHDTNYQKYIYNAEDEMPTTSQMQDIYTWLDAGNPVPSWAQSYLDIINGKENSIGFWWHFWNINTGVGGNYMEFRVGSANDYSWFRYPKSTRLDTTGGFVGRDYYVENAWSTPLFAVYIVSNGSGYSLYYDDWQETNCMYAPYPQFFTSKVYYMERTGNEGSYVVSATAHGNNTYYTDELQFNGTIEECLIYLCNNVRNVDIYVDGVLWSKAGL